MSSRYQGGPLRKNGFEMPLHPRQVLSWIILVACFVLILGALSPTLKNAGMKTLAIFTEVYLSIFLALHVIVNCTATIIDPADRHIYVKEEEDIGYNDNEAIAGDRAVEEGELGENQRDLTVMCQWCRKMVEKKSKHCRTCNKCVASFDHHCMWLNNCVGEHNYTYFVGTLATAFVLAGYASGLSLYVLIEVARDANAFLDESTGVQCTYFGSDQTSDCDRGLLAMAAVVAVLSTVGTLSMAQLGMFHIYISYRGITTYDYILEGRAADQRKQDERLAKEQAKAKAVLARESPSEQNKTVPTDSVASNGQAVINVKKAWDESDNNPILEPASGVLENDSKPPTSGPRDSHPFGA
eukprot:Clim_evm14s165 gene=Clim_evmTU14s165